MTREFIMTPEFDENWDKLGLSDDDLKELQEEILKNPQIGPVIKGTNGLRKMIELLKKSANERRKK